MRRARSILLVCALLFVPAAGASQGLPAETLAYAPQMRPLGAGPMRWFGLRLYDAELWVSGEGYAPQRPHALALRYQRAIDAERLVDTSIDEMRRLGAGDETCLARWRKSWRAPSPRCSRTSASSACTCRAAGRSSGTRGG